MLRAALSLWLTASAFLLVGTPGEATRPLRRELMARDGSCGDEVGWVSTWASGIAAITAEAPFSQGFADQTLRQIVHTSVRGSAVRVTIAGPPGPPAPPGGGRDLRIAAATVAVSTEPSGSGAAVRAGTVTPLTFGGQPDVAVGAAQRVTSDPVRLAVPQDHDVAVSLHFAEPTGPPSGRLYSGQTSWVGAGDLVSVEDGAGYTAATGGQAVYPFAPSYFLASVDVLAEGVGGLVLLGDSISDGYGFLWPPDRETVASERLFDRLAGPRPVCLAVTNVALAGNALLPFVDGYDAANTGLSRLDRDVLDRPGLRVIVVLLGINDLFAGGRGPDEIVAALAQVIDRGHAAGVQVVGATLPPVADSLVAPDPEVEMRRAAVNARILPGGPDALDFDAVVDVDAALRDPGDPSRIAPAYEGCAFGSCGHWHPDREGHQAVADAFDVEVLARLAAESAGE